MKKLYDLVHKIETVITSVFLVIVIVLICLQIVLRYVFGTGITWSDEIVGFLFVYICMIGSAMAIHNGEHTRLTLLESKLKPPFPAILRTLSHLLLTTFLVFFLIYSAQYARNNGGLMSTSLRIPMRYIYFSLPLGMVLMLLEEIIVFISDVRNAQWRKNK